MRAARRDHRWMATFGHARTWLRIAAALLVLAGALALAPAALAAAPPAGVTGFASTARVELAWQPSSGASAYAVYRGTSAGARSRPASARRRRARHDVRRHLGRERHDLLLRGPGDRERHRVASTPARLGGAGEPLVRTGNATVLENCLPGSSNWPTRAARPSRRRDRGLRDGAERRQRRVVGLKVNAPAGTFNVEVYRMGSYGGARRAARLGDARHPVRAAAGVPEQRHHRPVRLRQLDHDRDASARPRRGRRACTCCASCAAPAPTTTSCSRCATTRGSRTSMWGSAFSTFRPTTPTAAARCTTSTRAERTPSAVRRARSRSPSTARSSSRGRASTTGSRRPSSRRWRCSSARATTWATWRAPTWSATPGSRPAPGPTSRPRTTSTTARGCARRSSRRATAAPACCSRGANAVFWRVRFEASPQSGAADRVLVCYKTSETTSPIRAA